MNITIVDYYSGNVASVTNSFKKAGSELDNNIEVTLSNDLNVIENSDKLVLPGQGSFKNCINSINKIDGLRETLDDFVLNKKKPLFGICVGMQMFADYGEEDGGCEGFGWIKGKVKKMNIPERPSELGGVDSYEELFRLPHMGWNQVDFWPRSKNSDKLCGEFVGAAKHFYFVHSYIFKVEEHKNILATSYYAEKFTCGVNKENIFGTQFHPEKSGDNGLKLIKNFLTL